MVLLAAKSFPHFGQYYIPAVALRAMNHQAERVGLRPVPALLTQEIRFWSHCIPRLSSDP
jgi:hypothetical protein